MSHRWQPLLGFVVAVAPFSSGLVAALGMRAKFRSRPLAPTPTLRVIAWVIAGVLWTSTPVLAHDPVGILLSIVEVGSLVLTIEAGALLARTFGQPHGFAVGAVAALVLMALVSAAQLLTGSLSGDGLGSLATSVAFALGPDPLAFPGRAVGWFGHPNVWGALGSLAGVVVLTTTPGRGWMGPIGGTASLFVVLSSGSRSALLALLIGATVAVLGRTGFLRHGRHLAITAAAAVFAAGVLGWITLSAVGGRFDVSPLLGRPVETEPTTNLLRSSEDVLRDVSQWHRIGVEVHPLPTSDGSVNAVRVVKTEPAPDARIFQAVRVEPGEHYTVSVEIRPRDPEQRHGIAGWGRTAPDAVQASLNLAHRGNGVWRATSAGGIHVLGWEVGELDEGWWAGRATFRYEGDTAITWRVGVTVDQRSDLAAVAPWLDVRRLQLVPGHGENLVYQPTSIRSRQRAETVAALSDRLAIYRAAWDGVRRKPWFGWWFPATTSSDLESEVLLGATHAHNIVLETLYRRGAVGLFALGIMVTIVGRAALAADRRGLAVLLALAGLNIVDSLFWTSGLIQGASLWIVWLAGDQREHVGPHPPALALDDG